MTKSANALRLARQKRVRAKIHGTASRPRLHVFRSNRKTYAQIINDDTGKTLAAVSPQEIKADKSTTKTALATKQGELLAQKALKAKVKHVAFDRGSYKYHGRIKALADAARAAGLEF